MLRQTVKPDCYVVVDDGSTDGTLEYLESLRDQIILLRTPRKQRKYGLHRLRQVLRGVREASMMVPDWNYLYCLDADTDIPANYYETLLGLMREDPCLGTVSGLPLSRRGTGWFDGYKDKVDQVNCWDCAKLVRREAFNLLYDLYGVYGWDSLFQLYSWFNGWRTKAVLDTRFYEWRPQKTERSLRKWVDMGVCRSRLGYSLDHQLVSAYTRRGWKPRYLGSLLFVCSYLLHRALGKKLMSKQYYMETRAKTDGDLRRRLAKRRLNL
jgi:glycosyltransferase involved in cell wall biosynthesis